MNFAQMIARLTGSAKMIQVYASVMTSGLELIVRLTKVLYQETEQPQAAASLKDTNGVGLITAYNRPIFSFTLLT